jgi:hypothetical protein
MNSKVKRSYILEYIDNEKDFEYVDNGCTYAGEPMLRWKARVIKDHDEILDHAMEKWCKDNGTLQHVKVIDHLKNLDGEAMAMYLFYSFRMDIYDTKMMQQIWVDGELVYEEFVELPPTFISDFEKLINKDLEDRYSKAKAQINTLTKANEEYIQFLDKYKLTDAFRKETM